MTYVGSIPPRASSFSERNDGLRLPIFDSAKEDMGRKSPVDYWGNPLPSDGTG